MMDSQLLMEDITGEYFLQSTEITSGLQLNEDSTFIFFISEGDFDRYSTGSWVVKDGMIILNSRPQPDKDFRLIESKTAPDKKITIKINGDEPLYLGYVLCLIRYTDGEQKTLTDEDGSAQFPLKEFTSIDLLFQLCPERSSSFEPGNQHNYFEFYLEPWAIEIFFKNDAFAFEQNRISGTHPLIPADEVVYARES